jgi:hypothetical protein
VHFMRNDKSGQSSDNGDRKYSRGCAEEPVTFLGIDPGLGGALAILRDGDLAQCWRTPVAEDDVLYLLRGIPDPYFAVVERIPCAVLGTAKGSMSKLYGSYIGWRMALAAAGIPYRAVMASVWQRGLGIPGRIRDGSGAVIESRRKWKARLRDEAQRRYPELRVTLAVADALLLAYYAPLVYSYSVGGERIHT